MKKIILAILAIAVPEILLYSGCVVMNNGFITGCTIVVAAVMLYYTVRQFRSVGRWHNFDTTDAFWVSAIVGSVISAVYLGVLSGYGWKAIDGFAQRTFALGPVILAVVYGCFLGSVICILRLWRNYTITTSERLQTWCFLVFAVSIMMLALREVAIRYGGMVFPDVIRQVLLFVLALSLAGIVICGYRITILHK